MKRRYLRYIGLLLICILFLLSCKRKNEKQVKEESSYNKAKENRELSIWSYYSGAQLEAFKKTIDEFNEGRGRELNFSVRLMNPGSFEDIENNLLALTDKNFTQDDYPDMAFMYADIAWVLDRKHYLVDLSRYFSQEELDAFVPEFLNEGRLGKKDEGIKILPVGKSTELFFLNGTDWKKFADATGTKLTELETREGLMEVAKKYYEYTDALTPEENDGKPFFGMDDFANYFLVGAKQMGVDLISKDSSGNASYNFPKPILRKLWDNYYVPYIKGYFASIGRYRSDDVRTGEILSYVGSSAGYSYFPRDVILSDEVHYSIDCIVLPCPQFVKGERFAMQQGAGISVLNGNEERVKASVEFLRWLTGKEENCKFAMSAEYLPVRVDGFTIQTIDILKGRGSDPAMEEALNVMNSQTLYTTPPVANSKNVRNILENSLPEKAEKDRKEVETAMASGLSYEDAIGEYNTEENFNLWYDALLAEINQLQD